jgi:hypothetical protein
MKRSELKVGDELYHARPADWRDGTAGFPGRRVRVLSVGPHRTLTYSNEPIKTNAGNGVLVEVLDEQTGKPYTWRWGNTGYVVQLAHLRGPWAETLAAVERRRTENRAARDAATTAVRAVQAAADAAVDRARRDGIHSALNVTRHDAERLDWARVSISLDDLNAILEQLARLRGLEH